MSWGKRARLIANQALWALGHRFPFIHLLCLKEIDLYSLSLLDRRIFSVPHLCCLPTLLWMWSLSTPQWRWQATKCFSKYVSALHHKSWNQLGNSYDSTWPHREIWSITANHRARWLWTARLLSCRCQGPVWYAGEGLLQDGCSHTHTASNVYIQHRKKSVSEVRTSHSGYFWVSVTTKLWLSDIKHWAQTWHE